MSLRVLTLISVIISTVLPTLGAASPGFYRPVVLAASAPELTNPAEGEVISSFGPTLQWEVPQGTTQVHVQVIPFNNDGPGADLYLGSAATSFPIPAPPAWYGVLPDMSYTWRVQVSDAANAVPLSDPSWSAWAERHFRTPSVTSDTISLTNPGDGGSVSSRTPTLQWTNSRSDVFYYEVQLSKDPSFNTDPASAIAMVYWELRHGGVTMPANSYTVPSGFPLEENAVYYWRVRPRVQGDGTPVAWSVSSSFRVNPSPTPTATPTRTPTPTATATATPSPTVTPPTSGDRVAFVSTRSGLADIWVVRPDGSGLANLSRNSATDDKPAWSKDGTKIAFVSDRDSNREIYTMNADGSKQTRVTNKGDIDDDPAWSPDGSQIAFMSRRDAGIGQQIYVAKADGSSPLRITNNTAAHWNPAWSPDGTKIMYGSSRSNNLDIFTAKPDGTGETNLTNDPAADFDHSWSADGKKVAFTTLRESSFEIFSMNADGSSQVNLSHTAANESSPVWSPMGNKIAWVSVQGTDSEIIVANADGTGQINVSQNPAEDTSIAWSPDGTKLAFVSKRDGHKEIYVVSADSSGLTRLTNSKDDSYSPTWAPK